MREFLRVVGAFSIVMIIFFLTTISLKHFAPFSPAPPCPQGDAVELKPPFRKFGRGFAQVAVVPSLENLSDSLVNPARSKLLVCENNHALGPPHSLHAAIDAQGKGRFSHWAGMGFIFSASDNSDPNTNHRHYRAVLDQK
jgi:hypothetical protein